MTMHDLHYGKERPSDLADSREQISEEMSAFPPAYDEADDHGMLEGSFKHVSIPPPAPADDDSIVDIRVDEEANGDLITHVEEPVAGPSTLKERPLFITSHRASRQFLSHYSNVSYTIKGFGPVEQTSTGKTASQRSDSISSSLGSSSSDTPFQAILPQLSEEEMMEALPHPEAIFIPDLMRWYVLLSEDELVKKAESATIKETLLNGDEGRPNSILWRPGPQISIPKEDQKARILYTLAEEGDKEAQLEVIESFDTWQSTDESILLSTTKDSLQAAIPIHLLQEFQSDRLANPRAGFSGEAYFHQAIQTLIKIVSNAARGERRSLSVTGRVISQKLGLDDITFKILRLLGFRDEVNEDGSRKLIKPPDTTLQPWKVRLRRAWLEITLWYHSTTIGISTDAFWNDLSSCIPLLPSLGNPIEILERKFKVHLSLQRSVTRRYTTPDESNAIHFLGADSEADEAQIEQCYLVNTDELSIQQQIPFYSALQVATQYFVKAHNGDATDILDMRLAIEKSKGLVLASELKSAFAKIGLELGTLEEMHVVNDEFVSSIYQAAVDNVAANKEEVRAFKDALQIISASRGKPEVLERQVEAPVELSISKAYAILEVQSDTDDDFIASVFSVSLSDSAKNPMECTEALRVIAEERKSSTLRKLYRNATSQGEEWEPVNTAIPIGLNNIGNTCYLNSVLQYFFAIRTLRTKVITASQDEYEKIHSSATVRVGGRQVHQWEIDRSLRFVRELGQLFSNMISSPLSAVTPERELAYLALVSPRVEEENAATDDTVIDSGTITINKDTLDAQGMDADAIKTSSGAGTESTLVDEPTSIEVKTELPDRTDIKIEEEEEQDELIEESPSDGIVTPPLPPALPPRPPLPPRPVAAVDSAEIGQRRNSLMQLGTQQDVSECLDNVMFQIEVALTASERDSNPMQRSAGILPMKEEVDESVKEVEIENEDEDVLRRIFLGKTLQRTELANDKEGEGAKEDAKKTRGASIHTKREVFTTLLIDVLEEGRDIYDGLDGYFDEEIIDGAAGNSIRRMVTLLQGPAILQIQLQRVQFDRIKGAYKSQAHLEIGQSIFMDRYMDFDPSNPEDLIRLEKRIISRDMRKEIAKLRSRIKELEPEKVVFSRTLKQTSEYLGSLASLKGKYVVTSSSQDTVIDKEEESVEIQTSKEEDLMSLLNPGLNDFLLVEASRIEEEIKTAQGKIIELKMNVEELWKEEQRYEYILASVFMHRGEASHGHYFLNQRRLTQEDVEISNVWYKYNDQSVTEASWNDVHRDQSGATPYLLCWVRRDMLNQFDTLCRSYGSNVATISSSAPAEGSMETAVGEMMPTAIDESETAPNTQTTQSPDDTIMADASPIL